MTIESSPQPNGEFDGPELNALATDPQPEASVESRPDFGETPLLPIEEGRAPELSAEAVLVEPIEPLDVFPDEEFAPGVEADNSPRSRLRGFVDKLPRRLRENGPFRTFTQVFLGTNEEKLEAYTPLLTRAEASGRITAGQRAEFELQILAGDEGLILLLQDSLGATVLGWVVGKPVALGVMGVMALLGAPEIGLIYAGYDTFANVAAAVYFMRRTGQEIKHARQQIAAEGGSPFEQTQRLNKRRWYCFAMNLLSLLPGPSFAVGLAFTLPRGNGGLNKVLLREMPGMLLDQFRVTALSQHNTHENTTLFDYFGDFKSSVASTTHALSK